MKKLKQIGEVILEWVIEHAGDILGFMFIVGCFMFFIFMFRGCTKMVEREEKHKASFAYEVYVVDDGKYYTDEYSINPTNNTITFYDGRKSNTVVIVNQKVTIRNQHEKK